MSRDETSREEQEEEFDEADRRPRGSSDDDEGDLSDEDEETLEEEDDTDAQTDSEESEQEEDGPDWTRLETIPPADRPVPSREFSSVERTEMISFEPVQLDGTAPDIQPPQLHNTTPELQRESFGIHPITLDGSLDQHRGSDIDTQDEITLRHVPPVLRDTITVGSSYLEMEDPFYEWTGGTPYGSGRPAIILHVSPENRRGPSLTFLERRLRDEYTQQRGGEPQAKGVRLVANKPKIPNISNAIVTFDLTDEDWELEANTQPIRVKRNGEDALEYITETVQTTYAGDLGYLVVNLPERWRDPISPGDVIERIRRRLLTDADSAVKPWETNDDNNDSLWVARCEPDDVDAIRTQVARYWFGGQVESENEDAKEYHPTVQRYEAQFERGLRNPEWLATVLTEEHDNESEEHYLLKAKIAAGLANTLFENDYSTEDRSTFAVESLFPEGPIRTEEEENGTVIDLRVDWKRAFDSFVPVPETGSPSTIAFEIETGRAQAETGFRKIWKTVDRLAETDTDVVYVVVPPRLLLQRRTQADHLQKLVAVWNKRVESGDVDNPQAMLCVPNFDWGGDCIGLRKAKRVTREVYQDDDRD